ncbi:hypothetical protein Cadr_000029825 [Camelus dromedarius]|uniref:Uncharacterized protein n=1 Tax=Camelus dromedarius TaxID=9838 RepID=A0A5N4CCP7_CAMDR|nr:hypothetical protein Cadr_000029825 [Camelus dromedarius]
MFGLNQSSSRGEAHAVLLRRPVCAVHLQTCTDAHVAERMLADDGPEPEGPVRCPPQRRASSVHATSQVSVTGSQQVLEPRGGRLPAGSTHSWVCREIKLPSLGCWKALLLPYTMRAGPQTPLGDQPTCHFDILVSEGASPVSRVFNSRKRPAASRILLNSMQKACTSINKERPGRDVAEGTVASPGVLRTRAPRKHDHTLPRELDFVLATHAGSMRCEGGGRAGKADLVLDVTPSLSPGITTLSVDLEPGHPRASEQRAAP